MNPKSILNQFDIVDNSIKRAKLPFEANMLNKEVIEVTLYELIKTREQILNMIREIDPIRFGPQTTTVVRYLEPEIGRLFICGICGHTDCESDHK